MVKETDNDIESGSRMPNEDIENHGSEGQTPEEPTANAPNLTVEMTVTDQILTLNPEMAADGFKVGDKFGVDLKDTEPYHPTADDLESMEGEQIDESILAKLAKYSQLYPRSGKFHITSDGQVFLESSLSDAKNHQKGLGEGELKTYAV